MKLPIFYVKFMKRYVDLSALEEVSDAESLDYYYGGSRVVGFRMRFAGTAEWSSFYRPLIEPDQVWNDDVRDYDYVVNDKSEMYFERVHERMEDWNGLAHRYVMVGDEKLCIINMRREMQELLEAWSRWKEIEPTVYAMVKERI